MAFALLALSACGAEPDRPPQPQPETQSVLPNQPRRSALRLGEIHHYPIERGAEEVLQVEVEELGPAGKGIDVRLQVIGPFGPASPEIDSSGEATRTEPIFLVTEAAGQYLLQIWATHPGDYEIRLSPARKSTPEDQMRADAHRAFYQARELSKTAPDQAAELFGQAITAWLHLADRPREARANYELAELLKVDNTRHVETLQAYKRACGIFEELEDVYQGALCLKRLGRLYSRRGQQQLARDTYAASLAGWRHLDNLRQASYLAFDQATIERRLGQPEAARELLFEALDLAQQSKDLVHEAAVRTQLGALYHYRGEHAAGIREQRAALRSLASHPQPENHAVQRQRASTLATLAPRLVVEDPRSSGEEALAFLHEARALYDTLENRRGLAMAVNNLGFVHERMHQFQAALDAYRDAEEIYRGLYLSTGETVAMGNRCRILDNLGQVDRAFACFQMALPLSRQVGYQNTEAQILFGLADITRRKGQLLEARRWIERSLEVVELIRKEAASEDLRATSMRRGSDYYELAIEIALELHQRDPQAGYEALAFRDFEASRARSLLEDLGSLRPELELPPEVRALQTELYRLKVDRFHHQERSKGQVEDLERQIADLLGRLHVARPRYSLFAPPIPSVAEVQELLDDDTLLLEYHLGAHQSAVWALSRTEFVYRPLAPRGEIERVARELHRALGAGAHKIRSWNVERLREELSTLVLAPVADLLHRPQLTVVPTGALSYIPFAALPHPTERTSAGDSIPLLLSHRITSTPSASVVAALRAQQAERTPAPHLLALLAAPVLRADDPRLEGRALPPREGASTLPTELTEPLPYALQEAEAILRWVEGEDVLSATGFRANRDFVFDPGLGDYRILHFATHGHLDDTHGELSGLVLAQFDTAGQPIAGYLWAYELFQLRLHAELVVLSACKTALGEEVQGEGLMGLTRGFLYAGAEKVLVSLWDVDDQATAHLMESFYRGLLRRGLNPAEALRQAQIELRDRGWTAPYYWAPFVLQGDWSGTPLVPNQVPDEKNSPRP